MKNSRLRFMSLGFALALASSFLWLTWFAIQPVAAEPTDELIVCPSCEFTTVAAALTAASAGDTLVISTTAHTEPGLTINKSVTIQGLSFLTTTWFLSGSPLTIAAGQDVFLADLVLDAQNTTRVLHNNGELSLLNVVLMNGQSVNGAGLYNNGEASLTQVIVRHNTSSGSGAGIYNSPTGLLMTYIETIVHDNVVAVDDQGGGGLYNDGTAVLENSMVRDNLSGDFNGAGAGISNHGELTLISSTLYSNGGGNEGTAGAGLNNGFNAQATLISSVVQGNSAGNSSCGGICNNGELHLTDSIVAQNSSRWSGAGLNNAVNGSVWITNSTFDSNRSWDSSGGGIHNLGHLTIHASDFIENESTAWLGAGIGGAIASSGQLTITDSLFAGNYVTVDESGEGYGGAVAVNGGTALIQNVLFTNNKVEIINNDFLFAYGGALAVQGSASVEVINSTFSGNTIIVDSNGQVEGAGGAIFNAGQLSLAYTTIVENSSLLGGGVEQDDLGSLTIQGSIVVGNQQGDCLGNVTSAGYNLFGDGTGCPETEPTDLVIDGTNLFTTTLYPLADNGGETETYALRPGSAAVNHIPAGESGCGTTITNDQRGEPRPVGGACDMGAFEGNFTPASHQVTLTVADPEHGSVVNTQDGLPCSATCVYTVTHGSYITFTNQAEVGYATNWSGVCLGMMPSCLLYVTSDMNITAHFVPMSYTVSLTVTGPAGNGVSNSWDETTCLVACVYTAPHGLTITFTAVPTSGSVFESWSNGCGTGSSCTRTISAPLVLTAGFEAVLPPATYQQFLPLIVR